MIKIEGREQRNWVDNLKPGDEVCYKVGLRCTLDIVERVTSKGWITLRYAGRLGHRSKYWFLQQPTIEERQKMRQRILLQNISKIEFEKLSIHALEEIYKIALEEKMIF